MSHESQLKIKTLLITDDIDALKGGASFCYCAYVLRISGWSEKKTRWLPLIGRYFCAVYDYAGIADLSKGCWNPKRKWGQPLIFKG